MNEEILKSVYEHAKKNNYKGTESDFINLLQSNEKALGMAVEYAVFKGIAKDREDFLAVSGLKKKDQSQSAQPSAKTSQVSTSAISPEVQQPSGDSDGAALTDREYDKLYGWYGDKKGFKDFNTFGEVSEEKFNLFAQERERRRTQYPVAPEFRPSQVQKAKQDIIAKEAQTAEAAKAVPAKSAQGFSGVVAYDIGAAEGVDMSDPLYQKAKKELDAEKKQAELDAMLQPEKDRMSRMKAVKKGFESAGLAAVPEERISEVFNIAKGSIPGATDEQVLSAMRDVPNLVLSAPKTNASFEAEVKPIVDDLITTLEKAKTGDNTAKAQLLQYLESGSVLSAYNESASKYGIDQAVGIEDVLTRSFESKAYQSSVKMVSDYLKSDYAEGRKFTEESNGVSESLYGALLGFMGGAKGIESWFYDAIGNEAFATLASIESRSLQEEQRGVVEGQYIEVGIGANDWSKSYDELIREGKADLAAKKAGVDIGNAIPQIAADAAITYATGGTAGALISGGMGFVETGGTTYVQVREDQYMSFGEKTAYMTALGSVDFIFENLPIFRGAEEAFLKVFKKELTSTVGGRITKKIAENPVMEGVEEVLVSLVSQPIEYAFEAASLDREIDGYKQQFAISTDATERSELQQKIADAEVTRGAMKVVKAGELFDSFIIGAGAGTTIHVAARTAGAAGSVFTAKERAAIRSQESKLLEELGKTTDEARQAEIKSELVALSEAHNRLALKDSVVYSAMSSEEVKEVVKQNSAIRKARAEASEARARFANGQITQEQLSSVVDNRKKIVEEALNKKKSIESKYVKEASGFDAKAMDEDEIRIISEVSSIDPDITDFGDLADGATSIELDADNVESAIGKILGGGKIRSTKYSTAEQITKGLRNVVSTVKSLAKSSPGVKVTVHGTIDSFQSATGGQKARGYWMKKNDDGTAREIHLYAPALKANTAYHEAYHEAEFSELGEGASSALGAALAGSQFDARTNADLLSLLTGYAEDRMSETTDEAEKKALKEAIGKGDLGAIIKADKSGGVADEFLTELRAMIESGEASLDLKSSLAGRLKEFVSRRLFGSGVGTPKIKDVISAINSSTGKLRKGEAVSLSEEAKIAPKGRTTMTAAGKAQGLRTEPVKIEGSPRGTFLNIGLLEGMTDRVIPVQDILDQLPEDVEVIKSTQVQGTEPTASIELNRKLTDVEMDQLLLDTKQMAIPQLSDGEGVIHGTTEWGPFNSDYFVLPNNKTLSDYAKEAKKPARGNRLFSEPLEDATRIAERYVKDYGIEGYQKPERITSIDVERAKRISDAFDAMENNPTDPEVAEAYRLMAKETLDQYRAIISEGYVVEVNNTEPYGSSGEMIEDLRTNKRMKIFSTESGFGDEAITEEQRATNQLLQRTEFSDVNGVPLLVNDIFRFVHDFFGHAKLGNSFGAIGEENAWRVHAAMFTPKARRAMTSETRGQNSWVNFSGVNEEAFRLRDEARKLRAAGRIDEANELVGKVYETMSFAEQKVGLMPEWTATEGMSDTPSGKAQLIHDETGFVTAESMYEMLKDRDTSYLDSVIGHILSARERLQKGEVTEESVIKAWLITVASQGSKGTWLSSWEEKQGLTIAEEFSELVSGKRYLRPEGIAAAYLTTEDGIKLIEDIKSGSATQTQIKDMFLYIGLGRESQKSDWVHKTMLNGGPAKMTAEFNSNKGKDFESLFKAAIKHLNGVKDGKTAFFNQYFGVSSKAVLDAREYNAWVGAKGDKLTPEQKALRQKAERSGAIQEELTKRIEEVGIRLGYPPDLAGYMAHHAIWDAQMDSITKHEAEYLVIAGKVSSLFESSKNSEDNGSTGANPQSFTISGKAQPIAGSIVDRADFKETDKKKRPKGYKARVVNPYKELAGVAVLSSPSDALHTGTIVMDDGFEISLGGGVHYQEGAWAYGEELRAKKAAKELSDAILEYGKTGYIPTKLSNESHLSNFSFTNVLTSFIHQLYDDDEKSITKQFKDRILEAINETNKKAGAEIKISKNGDISIVGEFESVGGGVLDLSKFFTKPEKKDIIAEIIAERSVSKAEAEKIYQKEISLYSDYGRKASIAFSKIYKAKTVKELTKAILEFTDVENGMPFRVRKQFNKFLSGSFKTGWIKGMPSQESILEITMEEEMQGIESSGFAIGGKIYTLKKGVDASKAGWLFRVRKTNAKTDGYIAHQSYPYMIEVNTDFVKAEEVVFDKAYHASTLFSEFRTPDSKFLSQERFIKEQKKPIEKLNKFLTAYAGKVRGGAVGQVVIGKVMTAKEAEASAKKVTQLIEAKKSASPRKSGKAQGDLDKFVADLINKESSIPEIKAIQFRNKVILIDRKTTEYVKAGMAKPEIMRLLQEEFGMTKKDAEALYKRAKYYAAGKQAGKKEAYDFAKRTMGKWLDLRSREAIRLNAELKELLAEYASLEDMAESATAELSDKRMKQWSTDEFLIAALEVVNQRMAERGAEPFTAAQISSLFKIVQGTARVSADTVRKDGYVVVEAFINRLSKIFDAQDAKAEMADFKKKVAVARRLQARMEKMARAKGRPESSIQSFRNAMLDMAKIDPALMQTGPDEFIATATELIAAASKAKTIRDSETGEIIAVVPNPEGITAAELQAQVDRYAAIEQVFRDLIYRGQAMKKANAWANQQYNTAKANGDTRTRAEFKEAIKDDIADKTSEFYDEIIKAQQEKLIPATRKKLLEMIAAHNAANPNDQKSAENWEDLEDFYGQMAEAKAAEEMLRVEAIIDQAIGDLLEQNIETIASEREFASVFAYAIKTDGPVRELDRDALMSRLKSLSKRELLQLEFRMRDFVDNGNKFGLGQLEAALSAKLDGVRTVSEYLQKGVKGRTSAKLRVSSMFDSVESLHRLIFAGVSRMTMTKLRSALGITGIVSGFAMADADHADNIAKILDKIKEIEKNGGEIMSMKSRMIAQIYSMMRQYPKSSTLTDAESKAEWFIDVKNAAERSIADLKKQGRHTDAEIKEFEEAFSFLFDTAQGVDDLISDVESIRPDVVEFVNYMVDFHNRPEMLAPFSEYVEKFLGKEIELEANYTPIKVVSRTASSTVNAEQDLMSSVMDNVRSSSLNQMKKVAGASHKRNPRSLGGENLIGLDFLAINEATLRENTTLVSTIRPMIYAAKMFNSKEVSELIPDEVVRAQLVRKLVAYAGHHRTETPMLLQKDLVIGGKRVANPLTFLRQLAAVKAFGSIFAQTPKQLSVMASVVMNTKNKTQSVMFISGMMTELAIAATKAGLWFGKGDMKIALMNDGRFDLLRNSPVFMRDYDTSQINPYNGSISAKETKASKFLDRTSELSLANLKGTDKIAAISSWFAFYGDFLISEGLVSSYADIDWAREAASPNKEAISFADNIVSKDQNASTPREAVDVHSSGTGNEFVKTVVAILSATVYPYTRFALNKKRSISYSLVKLAKGDAEAKKEASAELFGDLVETAAFASVSYVMLPLLYDIMASMLGFAPEEEEEDEERRKIIEQKRRNWSVASQVTKDMIPLPLFLVSKGEDAMSAMINKALYYTTYADQWSSERRKGDISEGYKRWVAAGNGFPIFKELSEDAKNPFYYYMSLAGPQGQMLAQMTNNVSNFVAGGEKITTMSGKEYYIRPEDQQDVQTAYALKSVIALGQLVGLSSKEFEKLAGYIDDKATGRRLTGEEEYLMYIAISEQMLKDGELSPDSPVIQAIGELGLENAAGKLEIIANSISETDAPRINSFKASLTKAKKEAIAELVLKKEHPDAYQKYISELRAIYNAADKSGDSRAYMILNYSEELPANERQAFLDAASVYIYMRSEGGAQNLNWYMEDIRKERNEKANQ